MKTKASTFLKQMVSTIVAVVKAKSTVVRAKTSALKTRLLILGILRNKKLLVTAINTKIHAIMGQQQADHSSSKKDDEAGGSSSNDAEDVKKAIVLYSAPSYSFVSSQEAEEMEEEDGDEYLTHTLFAEEDDEEDELVRAPGSVIDVMRDAREREEGEGAEFKLEDEIDHVADVFIRRIHRQLKLQKLDSFKRFCEMLERGT
ncbi:hypothetical protein PR202_gb15915 [Eleusine coracana subsp. coracana]|uniref:Uncharacterized protein n=1 Tax=Eleusine coracana subsp. coracana TaxID=191504 RepID=A0AAV5EYW4_ELECO|nr:hypothetical protein QOZ80_4BG0352010 [Eleusine coracana subsp. coracana]GJN27860.1 hypothetical protein PR202_gb15915 [Eleusine coracana subsp. coracana]